MKLLKGIYRVFKQIFYLPRYLTNFLFGTFYYDNFLAKSKKKYYGNLPLNKKIVIFLIFPDYGLAESHLRTLRYFVGNNFTPLIVSNLPLLKKVYIDKNQLSAEKIVKVWDSLNNNNTKPSNLKMFKWLLKAYKFRKMIGKVRRHLIGRFNHHNDNNKKKKAIHK